MLRVISLFLVSDGNVQPTELRTLERLGVLHAIGANREHLARVFEQYCIEAHHHTGHSGQAKRTTLTDPVWIEAVLAPITGQTERRFLAMALIAIARADGSFADDELMVVRRLLDRWYVGPDELAQAA
jgi:tellurite resistance protein